MGKRELVALFSLSFWCLLIVVWLFLAVPWDCLQFVIVIFPDLTRYLFADDTVLFAESAEELQTALNAMFFYCET